MLCLVSASFTGCLEDEVVTDDNVNAEDNQSQNENSESNSEANNDTRKRKLDFHDIYL